VIAEAMAAGTAVVATETEGAKEVIEDQKTGILVPIGDVNRIAEAVTALLADNGEIGARAKESANAKFSLKRMVDEIEKIYTADLR
jgi:glycosyltransferase involved in cell wall biosynthesis